MLGIKDEYSGEVPKAFVVVKKGVNESEEVGRRLLEYVKSRKVRYKWINEVEFVGELPKSPTGKLLRRVLKQREMEVGRTKGVVVRELERPRL